MIKIRFPEEREEEGVRVIVLSGMVEYTPQKWVYRVPNYVLNILESKNIPYERVEDEKPTEE